MFEITNEMHLAAVSGGLAMVPGSSGPTGSTNMSQASAGTDAGYYGSSGAPAEPPLGILPATGLTSVIISVAVGIFGAITSNGE